MKRNPMAHNKKQKRLLKELFREFNCRITKENPGQYHSIWLEGQLNKLTQGIVNSNSKGEWELTRPWGMSSTPRHEFTYKMRKNDLKSWLRYYTKPKKE